MVGLADIPQPTSVDVPTGAQRTIMYGGEIYTVDLMIFPPGGVFPPDITPVSTRAPGVLYEGVRYRVIKVRDFRSVSDHAEVYLARDLGREPG